MKLFRQVVSKIVWIGYRRAGKIRRVHTKCCILPDSHETTQSLDHVACLDRPTHGSDFLVERGQRHGSKFVAAELSEELLLCRKIEVFIRLDLFLKGQLVISKKRGRNDDVPRYPPYSD